MDKIPLQKVNVIGEKYFHSFEMEDLSIVEVETTGEDYAQLAGPDAVNPEIKGGKWVHSFSRYKFDTPDGDLGEDQYHENGLAYCMKRGNKFFVLNKEEVIDDQVEKVVLDEAETNLNISKSLTRETYGNSI